MLEIRLFGAPEVLWNNAPLSLQRRANRAMLFYLAAQGRAVDRDALTELLWPHTSLKDSRARLRETLSRLRESLPAENLLVATPDTITFDFSQVRVDYLEFMRLSNTIANTPWRIPSEMPLPPSLYEMMSRLTALFRLPGFLNTGDADFSPALSAWRDGINNTTRLMTLRCIDRLFEHALLSASIEEALDRLHTAIRIDPYNEERQARFLTTMLNAGLLQPARKHYQSLENQYRNELNLPLPEEIATLKARLFDDSRPAGKNVFTWPLRPTLKAPFVGRESSLRDLRRHFVSGGGVIILGEAGSGKTRLVQEFYKRLSPSPRLMMGVCRPMASNLPFQPWIDLLRRCISSREWKALPPAWFAPLARLMPELYEMRPDLDNYRSEVEHPKSVFFESVRQILLVASSSAPLIIFIDDVHWADDSSLGLLAYLLEQGFFTGRHGFLIMTSRLEERNASLDRLLSASYLNRVNPIQLGQLSIEEIGQLVHHVLREPPPPGFAERLAREVGGNPFAILETIGAFLDRPTRPSLAEITRLPLVSGVHQMILARLRMVSHEGRDVLRAAALYGGSLTIEMLSRVVSLPEAVVARVFVELEALHFIQPETSDGAGNYTFVHEKFRESLLQDISPAQNHLFNRRIAEVLAADFDAQGPAQAAIIAQHFEAAGLFPQAFDYWVKAAQYAYRLAAVAKATELYKRAERLIARVSNFTEEQLYTLYASWSDMASVNDDVETLFRINKMLLAYGEERGSDLLMGIAYDGLGVARVAEKQFAEGLDFAKQSLAHLERSGYRHDYLKAQTHYGINLMMLGRLPESLQRFTEALASITDVTDPRILRARGSLLYQLSLVSTLSGQPTLGLEYATQCLADHTRLGWAYGQVSAYAVLGMANYYLGQYEAGYQSCLKGIAQSENIQGWRMPGYLYAFAAHLALELGLLGPAWDYGQQAIFFGETHQNGELLALGYKAHGDIYLRLRQAARAAEIYQQGLTLAGEHFVSLEYLYRLGYALLQLGVADGWQYIIQSIERSEAMGLRTISANARLLRLELFDSGGTSDSFEAEADDLMRTLQANQRHDLAVQVELIRVRYFLQQGQDDRARKVLGGIPKQEEARLWIWPRITLNVLRRHLLPAAGQELAPAQTDLANDLTFLRAQSGNAPLSAALADFEQWALNGSRLNR
ncbi:MAG: AAA family ATPase [Anaerolineales bacterium]